MVSDAAFSPRPAEERRPACETEHAPPAEASGRPAPRLEIQAFCESLDTASGLRKACEDRRLAKARVAVQMGGVQAAVAFYRSVSTPSLIVIESLLNREEMLADLDRLAEVCDPATKVVAIGHVNDVLLHRELLRRGVSEYVMAPIEVPQLTESISAIYSDADPGPAGQVIAFVGAKGGAGSSTVCHNTAFAVSVMLNRDVVIADFDLPFGTVGLDFNQDPAQGIADALEAPGHLDEIALDRLLSRCSDHLSLFAAPGTLDHTHDIEPEACETVLDVVRQTVPWIAVDLPHLWTAWPKHVLLGADRVVITAVPDLANLRNATNLVDQLKASRPNDRLLLVLNQVDMPKRPEIPAKDFGQALELEPDAIIGFDAHLFGTAANNGQMIEEVAGKSRAAGQFRALAGRLTECFEPEDERRSFLSPLLSRLRRKQARKA